MKIFVKQLDGKVHEIETKLECTISELKEQLEANFQFPKTQQRLIYSGKPLDNTLTLQECQIIDKTTIHLVVLPVVRPEPPKSEKEKKEEAEQKRNYQNQAKQNTEEEQMSNLEEVANQILINGTLINLVVNGNALCVANREVYVSEGEAPTTFILNVKNTKLNTLVGFQNAETKEYLFSSPPGQSLFHGKYGQAQVFCRYPFFSFGEEFIITKEGFLQSYRNRQYCVLKDKQLYVTPNKQEASKFEIKKLIL